MPQPTARRRLSVSTAVFAFAALLLTAGCVRMYGFAGGGTPLDVKTVAVLPFDTETTSPDLQRELTEAEAAEAHDVAALKCQGLKAKTNFPVER